jgi:hypothetical protein
MASSDERTTSKALDDDSFIYSSVLIGREGGATITGGDGLGGSGVWRAQPAMRRAMTPNEVNLARAVISIACSLI